MTCIVAVETDGGAWIGADSLASAQGWACSELDTPKIYEPCAGVAVGVMGSIRFGNIARYRWGLIAPWPSENLDEWVFGAAEKLRHALNDHGSSAHIDHEHRTTRNQSGALIAVCGRVYTLGSEFGTSRELGGYAAAGSGEVAALGSLFTSGGLSVGPEQRVRLALESAARHADGVRGPFDVRFIATP